MSSISVAPPLPPAALALQPALNQALMYYGDIAHEYAKLGKTVEAAGAQLEELKNAFRRAIAEGASAPGAPQAPGPEAPHPAAKEEEGLSPQTNG